MAWVLGLNVILALSYFGANLVNAVNSGQVSQARIKVSNYLPEMMS